MIRSVCLCLITFRSSTIAKITPITTLVAAITIEIDWISDNLFYHLWWVRYGVRLVLKGQIEFLCFLRCR